MPDTYQFSLSDGINTVTSSGLISSPPKKTKDVGAIVKIGLDGTTRYLTRYDKISHEISVNNVSATDAGYVNTWQSLGTTLTYTPDTGSAGTTHSVIIINTEYPLSWMEIPTKYRGIISIREV